VWLLVEDCEAPLVVEETELCSAELVELERPDLEDWLKEGEEPKVDPDEELEVVVLITLPEPLAVAVVGSKKLPVDGMTAFESDQK
jgi:hypothetical protein